MSFSSSVTPVNFFRVISTVTSNQKMWCWLWKVTLSLQTLACAKRSVSNNMVCVWLDTFLRTWTLVLRPARFVAHRVSWPLKYSCSRSMLLQWTGNLFNMWSNLYCMTLYQVGSWHPSFQHAGRSSAIPGSWRCSLQKDQNWQCGFPCKICKLPETKGTKVVNSYSTHIFDTQEISREAREFINALLEKASS